MTGMNREFCLRWNSHQSTIISVFENLLNNETLVDCTLAAGGQYLKAHKLVLSACSTYLESLLSQHMDKHPILLFKDIEFPHLKRMLEYMYNGEVNIEQNELNNFLRAAESLEIKGLTVSDDEEARNPLILTPQVKSGFKSSSQRGTAPDFAETSFTLNRYTVCEKDRNISNKTIRLEKNQSAEFASQDSISEDIDQDLSEGEAFDTGVTSETEATKPVCVRKKRSYAPQRSLRFMPMSLKNCPYCDKEVEHTLEFVLQHCRDCPEVNRLNRHFRYFCFICNYHQNDRIKMEKHLVSKHIKSAHQTSTLIKQEGDAVPFPKNSDPKEDQTSNENEPSFVKKRKIELQNVENTCYLSEESVNMGTSMWFDDLIKQTSVAEENQENPSEPFVTPEDLIQVKEVSERGEHGNNEANDASEVEQYHFVKKIKRKKIHPPQRHWKFTPVSLFKNCSFCNVEIIDEFAFVLQHCQDCPAVHRLDSSFKYFCFICNYHTNKKTPMRWHLDKKHIKFPEELRHTIKKVQKRQNYDIADTDETEETNTIICPKCNQECLETMKNIYIHSKNCSRVKRIDESYTYVCFLCEYHTHQGARMRKHIETLHIQNRAYKCIYCPFSTNQQKLLFEHVGIHKVSLDS